jgi:hypothetical protein
MRTSLLVVIALAAAVTTAEARPRPARSTSNFQANKVFGLGLELGEPTGLIGKYFLAPSHALDFGIGAWGYYGFRDRAGYAGGFNLYLDYLWHPISLVSAEAFELPFYVGVGGRFVSWDYNGPGNNGRDSALGLRVPFGISFDMNDIPFDFFAQFCYTADFYDRYGGGGFYSDFGFSIGARYWFK